MAHNVVIKKIPLTTKDQRIVKGKYTYQVSCKRCGSLHQNKITGEGVANLAKANHHIEIQGRHAAAHPSDRRGKSGPTSERVQRKMVKLRG